MEPLDLDAMVRMPVVPALGGSPAPEREETPEVKMFTGGRYPMAPRDGNGVRMRLKTTTPEYVQAWAEWMERRRRKPGMMGG